MGENITSRFSASSRHTNLYTANPIQELHEQVLVRLQTTIRPVWSFQTMPELELNLTADDRPRLQSHSPTWNDSNSMERYLQLITAKNIECRWWQLRPSLEEAPSFSPSVPTKPTQKSSEFWFKLPKRQAINCGHCTVLGAVGCYFRCRDKNVNVDAKDTDWTK